MYIKLSCTVKYLDLKYIDKFLVCKLYNDKNGDVGNKKKTLSKSRIFNTSFYTTMHLKLKFM